MSGLDFESEAAEKLKVEGAVLAAGAVGAPNWKLPPGAGILLEPAASRDPVPRAAPPSLPPAPAPNWNKPADAVGAVDPVLLDVVDAGLNWNSVVVVDVLGASDFFSSVLPAEKARVAGTEM